MDKRDKEDEKVLEFKKKIQTRGEQKQLQDFKSEVQQCL